MEKLEEFMEKEGYSKEFTEKVINDTKQQLKKTNSQGRIYNASIGLMVMALISLIALWCSI